MRVQALARDVLHGDPVAGVRVPNVEDLADVRMVERGGGARLTQQLLAAARRVAQELQRHVPLETSVTGAIDLTHAPLAELVDDEIWADGLPEPHRVLRLIA